MWSGGNHGPWRRRHPRTVSVALLGATLLLLLGSPASAATWTRVASPNLTQFDNVLFGVDAISPSNTWAVGRADNDTSPFRRPLIQRWNGASWSIVPSPTPSGDSELRSVDGSSASNVWAVGFTSATSSALIQRWNGASWTTVPGPSGSSILLGVKTLSANDAWVVGSRSAAGPFTSMAARWNGTRWTSVSTPTPNDLVSSQLNAIDGTSSNDLWAVGHAGGGNYETRQPFILRWNGSAWSAVPIPPAIDATLEGVVALASNDVWAVGQEFNRDLLWHVPWVLHWNGQSWSKVGVPAVLGGRLSSVTALSPTRVYAVGGSLALRWNGSSWTRESIPSSAGSLWDAAAVGPSTVWAVGQRTRTSGASGTSIVRTTNG
jgi:hypothetical protein